MGNARDIGAFKVQYQRAIGKFFYNSIDVKVIGSKSAAFGKGSRHDQVQPSIHIQEQRYCHQVITQTSGTDYQVSPFMQIAAQALKPAVIALRNMWKAFAIYGFV